MTMALLWRSRSRQRCVKWPEFVDERLEILVRLAIAEGEQANGAQMLGALVASCPIDPGEIAERLKQYRRLHEEEFRTQVDPVGLPELRRTGPPRRSRD